MNAVVFGKEGERPARNKDVTRSRFAVFKRRVAVCVDRIVIRINRYRSARNQNLVVCFDSFCGVISRFGISARHTVGITSHAAGITAESSAGTSAEIACRRRIISPIIRKRTSAGLNGERVVRIVPRNVIRFRYVFVFLPLFLRGRVNEELHRLIIFELIESVVIISGSAGVDGFRKRSVHPFIVVAAHIFNRKLVAV